MSIFKHLRYKKVAIAIGMILSAAALCCLLYFLLSQDFFNSSTNSSTNDDDERLPVLNLTKNAMWDNPALGGTQYDDLYNLIYHSPDSIYGAMSVSLDSVGVPKERVDSVSRIIDNMPESQFKGILRLDCLNNQLFTFSEDDLTPLMIHNFLEKGYEIASGPNPISQSTFFVFWNNCVLQYSNSQHTDSVSKEAVKLMRICRRQNLPVGMIYAYTALGYCLMDAHDYQGASEHFDKAMELAEQHMPMLHMENWNSKDSIEESDFMDNYLLVAGLNAQCHIEANDTAWLKKHEEKLLNILRSSSTFYHKQDIYYSLAIYYDKWGYPEKYENIMKELRACMDKEGYFSDRGESIGSSIFLTKYKTILLRHELRNKNGDKAMEIIKNDWDYYSDSTASYLPDALLLQGKYKEAAERYKTTIGHYYEMLNGRNRYLIQSLSTSILEENRLMELRMAELESQRRYRIYNTIIVVALTIMICGLGFFLYRQRKLNKKLNEALAKAERASYVRDIFLKNMRHEVNTPLNAIHGFAQLLTDRNMPLDDSSMREMADGILEGSEKLMRLHDNIFEATDRLSKLDHLEDVESILNEMEQET